MQITHDNTKRSSSLYIPSSRLSQRSSYQKHLNQHTVSGLVFLRHSLRPKRSQARENFHIKKAVIPIPRLGWMLLCSIKCNVLFGDNCKIYLTVYFQRLGMEIEDYVFGKKHCWQQNIWTKLLMNMIMNYNNLDGPDVIFVICE